MESQQTSEFNLSVGERLKDEGMDLAATNRARTLRIARMIAKFIARRDGTVTADDVQEILIQYKQPPLGNAAGSLFAGSEWEFTGVWRKSARVSNHAHENRVWRLR